MQSIQRIPGCIEDRREWHGQSQFCRARSFAELKKFSLAVTRAMAHTAQGDDFPPPTITAMMVKFTA
jgi:hypothetical protein